MNPGSIDNWFALPPPRAASYLPAPYGARRDVTDRFARLSPGMVYLPAVRSYHDMAVAADARAADFGHDNLAWSRTPPLRGRGRVVSAAIGGALLGAALTALLGVIPADRWAGFGHVVRGSLPAEHAAPASVVAAVPEAAPAPVSAPAPAPAPAPVSALPPAPVDRSDASFRPARAADGRSLRRPGTAGTRSREHGVVRPVAARAAPPHVPAKPQAAVSAIPPVSATPDPCGADWPCGEALRSLQVELKRWETRKPLPASGEGNAVELSVRLTDHLRVTEW